MNVISDALIMIIPIPLLVKLQVPLHRKAILAGMFSSGVFIMVCTVLRAYYSLKSLSTLSIALNWANRECFVAAIVVSLPGIKPLFRNTRWIGSSGHSGYRYGYKGSRSGNGTGTGPSDHTGFSKNSAGKTKTFISYGGERTGGSDGSDGHELGRMPRPASSTSKEFILDHAQQESPPESGLAIRVTTEYTLERDENRV